MKNYREVFNPSKITISGKCKILTTGDDKYVVKEKNKDIKSLYEYLANRNFKKYVKLIDEYDDNYVYEYLKDVDIPVNQKMVDMAKSLSELHYKTSFFKEIKLDKYKKLYEDILDNVLYLEGYYNQIFDKALAEEYIRPSYYILLINSSLIKSNIEFVKKEVEKWYREINDLERVRVVYNHNNLTIDHYINNKFISWDNYSVDSPVLDLINLYYNDCVKYDFGEFLKIYLSSYELLDYEKTLLFIMISMPKKIDFINDEFKNTINVSKYIDYINSTKNILRPYYTE